MYATRRHFIVGSTLTLLGTRLSSADSTIAPPAPFGALPSADQLEWAKLQTYAFLHFTVNTFTDREWGFGDEDPNVFNPTAFDADSILSDLKRAGMRAVILTCKHHDGFCLWPTRTTEHAISRSSWKGGNGDIVREISEAAHRHDMKFGIYVSPWDRNNASYGTPEYLRVFHGQIKELLANYGPVFEVWFDGANGGDGYYGGAREKRAISKDYYDWPTVFKIVRRLQPHAVVFGAEGDIRWVGNEDGIAGETCWETYTSPEDTADQQRRHNIHDSEDSRGTLPAGTRFGKRWMPAECDVSIRPGWFYHSSQDSKVRTSDGLLNLYFQSVGRGANLLLNFPPNREGRIGLPDVESGAALHQRLESLFKINLASYAKLHPSNIRGGDRRFGSQNLTDGQATTYWATDDQVHTPDLVIEFPRVVQVSVIRLREAIELGQRIGAVELDSWHDGAWEPIASATSIGSCRLIRFDRPINVERLRMRITNSPAAIALSEFGAYAGPV